MNKAIGIVLAAGEGTRMKSSLAKPLHQIAHKSMLGHVLSALSGANIKSLAVVVNQNGRALEDETFQWVENPEFFIQSERLGTAHAVLAARKFIEKNSNSHIIIAFADTPLITKETFATMLSSLDNGNALCVLGFRPKDPTGYGRLIMQNGTLIAIKEDNDATEEERQINLCNSGMMALSRHYALKLLEKIDNENFKGEYYLTDAVQHASKLGLKAVVVETDEKEVHGVNNRIQLAQAENYMQEKLRERAMLNGATMTDPATVFLSFDTRIGKDVVFEPNVIIGRNVIIEDHVTIHSCCHIENTHLLKHVHIGPFARLRSNAIIEEKAKVGNFVEVKNSTLGVGVKAGHLAYLGDSTVGKSANIGAGTITCNYDGKNKFKTVIGEGAFIGSNSSLVAPVTIGKGAYVGSGSVITDNVPEDALALGRARQVLIGQWAANIRKNWTLLKE